MKTTKKKMTDYIIWEVREGFKDLRTMKRIGYNTQLHQAYGRVACSLRLMFFYGMITTEQHDQLVGVAVDTLYD
jgi:hypothetical protein